MIEGYKSELRSVFVKGRGSDVHLNVLVKMISGDLMDVRTLSLNC